MESEEVAAGVEGHVIVVGGSGMLRAATLELADDADVVTVIARNSDRLSAVVRQAAARGGRIDPISVDYRDTDALVGALEDQTASYGRFGLAVCWIHGKAPGAATVVAKFLAEPPASPGRYFHVLSHTAADPDVSQRHRERVVGAAPHTTYRQVVLGRAEGGSRWLSHAEISAGVLEAITVDKDRIVGVL